MRPADVAHSFAAAINRRNAEELARWMTEDHVFLDSLGAKVAGREKLKAAWESYFRMVPDYTIAIDETFVSGSTVVLLGTAKGTFSVDGALQAENRWSTSAAWRASIRGNFVAEWRVYADNEPIRQVMSRARPVSPPVGDAGR